MEFCDDGFDLYYDVGRYTKHNFLILPTNNSGIDRNLMETYVIRM